MNEILSNCPEKCVVLDLGCAAGSFKRTCTSGIVVRFDRDRPSHIDLDEMVVQGDAASLPFAAASVDVIIANHSLEHFEDLDAALSEIGRVVRPDGALFISVPDAGTFTDHLYRWLARVGGHVNSFLRADALAQAISASTGLRHVATRTLCSSLSFLNARHAPKPRPRRVLAVGGGAPWSLLLYTWLSRRIDRIFDSRTSVYGWALYFGSVGTPVDTATRVNVCIACGSSTPAALLVKEHRIRRKFGVWFYSCGSCGATNTYADDRELS